MRRTALALLPLALVARWAEPQAATASVVVSVRAEARAPLPGVRVELALLPPSDPSNGARVRVGGTDERGVAVFHHLRPGHYRVQAEATGMGSEVRRLAVGPGEAARVAIDLLPSTVCDFCARAEVEGRSGDRATSFSADDLRALPRPADPWSVLRDVPGVVVDRVDVGGSETAQQSLLLSHGDGGAGARWTIDGADVTDPAALGFTAVFPDMDAVDALQVRTSSLDVRVRTPGVQIGLFLREPQHRFGGAVHLRGTGRGLESDDLSAQLRSRTFLRNQTDHVLEMGAEAGGRVGPRRLWLWGAVARSSLAQDTFTEHGESLRSTSFTGKGRVGVGSGTLSILVLRSEKVDEDRDTTGSAAPEARWRQSGPAALLAVEDQRMLGSVSLLTHASYLDGGFRLDPQGGTAASAFEDYRGIAQGSYETFATDRSRLQAGTEVATRRGWLGLDHELLLGAGLRRSPVTTSVAWPGNKVLGFERRTVFFRAFELTGFAIPTRDAAARSVVNEADVYAQDTVRRGRLTFSLGARLDRLTGRTLASHVDANPVFPDLLPAVEFAGGPTHIRWTDLLPRAGLAWDVSADESVVARATYAAYGAPLGSGDVTFDDPIGRDAASVVYYWRDANGDHVVEPGELDTLRGQLSSSGIDPSNAASAASPNAIDPLLRSPRTQEVTLSIEESFGRALRTGLHLSLRRTRHPLWSPLRNLGLADYVVRGAVQGALFGSGYSVGYFAPATQSKIVPGNGRILTNREGYRQEALVLEAEAGGRAGDRLRWNAWGAFTQWVERFDDRALAVQDPTPLDTGPLIDGGPVAVRPGGLGRGDVFASARWAAGASLRADLPWRLEASALLHARDGFPIPYFEVGDTGDPTSAAKNVLVAPRLDAFRLPALLLLDAHLGRAFRAGRGRLGFAIDAFNVLNRGTTLQVARDVDLPAFDRPREIVRPRILRLGVSYLF